MNRGSGRVGRTGSRGTLERLAALRREEGQALIMVAICLIVFLGIAGLVIDVGEEYVTQRHLQTAADAAALAAAYQLPNDTTDACTYSASSTGSSNCVVEGTNVNLSSNAQNFSNNFGNVQTTATIECLSAASAGTSCRTGTACNAAGGYAPGGSSTNLGCNAIKVTETTTVTPLFMRVLGFGGQKVSASATAGIAGGVPHPLDVEMIDDTTQSMQTHDTCGGTPTDVPSGVTLTQEDCAKAGIRAFLTTLFPCFQSASNCGSLNNQTTDPAGPIDEVGLVAFPGLTSNVSQGNGLGVPDELDCASQLGSSNVTYGASANYQIVPFSSDFRYNDTATSDPLATLNPNSNLIRAVYWPGDGCPNGGYPIPGGPTSSIAGGSASGDFSTASTSSTAVGAGAAACATANTTCTVNSGITQGASQATTSSAGIALGSQAGSATAPLTTGGGPDSGDSGDRTTKTQSNSATIAVGLPGNTATGDFLLATVTGQAAGLTSNSSICAPSGWSLVQQNVYSSSGTPIIQATFSGVRGGTGGVGSGNQTFTSYLAGCSGSTIKLYSSAIITHYTNVAGVDTGASAHPGNAGAPATTSFAGSAPNGTAFTPTLNFASPGIGKRVWGNTSYASVSTTCASGSSGTCLDTTIGTPGTITGFTFTFGSLAGASYTATLMLNPAGSGGTAATTLTCSIASNQSGCTASGGTVAVGIGDTIELQIIKNSGTSVNVAATTSSAVETGSQFVSLSPPACASTSASTCDVTSVTDPGTVTSAGLTFGANVPSGDTFTVTLYQNGAATGSTCTIAAGSNSCTMSPSLTVAANDLLELGAARTAGTAAFTTTASTTAAESTTLITAPQATTTAQNDDVVTVFGTGAGTFATGNGLGVTATNGSTTGTGAEDAVLGTPGTTPVVKTNSSSPANWAAQTISLQAALPTSITVSQPSGYAAGKLLLVTIAAQNLGSGVICAPSSSWNAIATTTKGSSPSQVTQSTFWTSAASPGYTFTFYTTSACSGTTVQATASEEGMVYTGVDVSSSSSAIDATGAAATGSTATLMPNSVTPNTANDEVVSLLASGAPSMTVNNSGIYTGYSQSGSSQYTSSGIVSQAQASPVSVTPPTATSSAAASWTAQTVALKPALSSTFTVTPPSDYTANSGQVLLVSIATQGNVGAICAPDASWSSIGTTTQGSGATGLTQTTFSTTSGSSYTFTFYSGSSCSGGTAKAAANAVATTYNGVDTTVTPTVTSNHGSSGTASASATVGTGHQAVNFFATESTFTNASPAFSANAQTANNVWTNVGESLPTGSPDSATATNQASAPWTSQVVDLTPLLASSVTVSIPSGYTPGGSELVLVTVSATGIGSGSICAPDSTWSAIPVSTSPTKTYAVTHGNLTQESFYTTSTEATSATFSFFSKSTCNGTATGAGASAVAVNYTGINPGDPIDGNAVAASGATSPIQPGQITTSSANEEVVSVFGTTASTLTGPTSISAGNSLAPSSGVSNVARASAGAYTPTQATSNPTGSDWTAETIALNPLATNGITIARPSTLTSGDFILVTVSASGLPANSTICPPNDGTWTTVDQTRSSGTLDQETFYSARSTSNTESYTFTFQTACTTAGTPVAASGGTAVAARFTGVNPITPIDTDVTTGAQAYAYNTGSGTSVNFTGHAVTPLRTGDVIVSLYGTDATSLSATCGTGSLHQATGSTTATGLCTKTGQAANTAYTPPAATTTSQPWVAQGVALESASGGCGSGCEYGVEDPGGAGTDYGRAIAAAEANLEAYEQANNRTTAQKVIVLLSDGDATAYDTNPCQYGITQAEQAESKGTWIFAIAYGSDYHSGQSCTSDTSGTLHSQYLTSQCAMRLIADNYETDPAFSGDTNNTAAFAALCPPNTYEGTDAPHRFFNEATGTSLEDVFHEVGVSLTTPRIISNDAT